MTARRKSSERLPREQPSPPKRKAVRIHEREYTMPLTKHLDWARQFQYQTSGILNIHQASKSMKRIAALTMLLASVLAHSMTGLAQDISDIKTSYARGRLIRISNMNASSKSDYTCQIKTYVGAIAALKYDEEETEPYAIIIQLKNGRRIFIGLDENLYQGLSRADLSVVEVTLVKGKRVRVRAYGCGASGRGDLSASSIEFL
jgi:hypothetical protein